MIVKVKTRKKPSFRQLLNYILHDKERNFDNEKKKFLFKHNLKGNTIEEWEDEYKQNESYRKIRRSDSVILSHEILSFHKNDTKNISPDKLEEITREYINIRNPSGMYIAAMHTDRDHYHIHLCASGLEYHTGKSLRMTKPEFAELKKQIQNYQREKFPELSESIVEHGKSEKKELALSDKEYQIRRRTGRASDKEKINSILKNCYKKARTKDDFFRKLTENGLQTYFRGGNTTGIVYANRKYRLKKLGLTPELLNELNVEIRRGRELERVRDINRGRGRELER